MVEVDAASTHLPVVVASSSNLLRFSATVFLLTSLKAAIMQPLLVTLTYIRVGKPLNVSPLGKGAVHRRYLQGLPVLCLGAALSDWAYLTQYQAGLSFLPDVGASLGSFCAVFMSSFMSDCTRQVCITPFSVVATQQMLATSSKTATSVVRTLFQERGARSLFAGLGTSLVFGPLWTASWWVLYDAGKQTLGPWCSSIMASASTAVVFTPFLVIRTRLQAASSTKGLFPELSSLGKSVPLWRRCCVMSRLLVAGTGWTVVHCTLDGLAASWVYETASLQL